MRISDWSSDVCSSDLLVGGHHMVRAIAIGGGQFDHLVHHLIGIARATAELEAALAQRGDTRQRAGDQGRVLADLGDLQRHKALINRRHIFFARQATETAMGSYCKGRQVGEGADISERPTSDIKSLMRLSY